MSLDLKESAASLSSWRFEELGSGAWKLELFPIETSRDELAMMGDVVYGC